jgi:hypothetical protein
MRKKIACDGCKTAVHEYQKAKINAGLDLHCRGRNSLSMISCARLRRVTTFNRIFYTPITQKEGEMCHCWRGLLNSRLSMEIRSLRAFVVVEALQSFCMQIEMS